MSTLSIQMPEGLAQRLAEAARAEGVTLDQFLASAASEKLSAWLTVDYLRQRAARARREVLRHACAGCPLTHRTTSGTLTP